MRNIKEAKSHLRDMYRHEDGFVGVGIGEQDGKPALKVYVVDETFPIAKQLVGVRNFEGFPVKIEVTGEIKAF